MVINFSGCLYFYNEDTFKSEYISLFYRIENLRDSKLDDKYFRKFCFRNELVVKHLLIRGTGITSVLCLITALMLGFMAYFDTKIDYSLISLLFWGITSIFAFCCCVLIALSTLTISFLVSIYMKYRFQQTSDKLELHSKNGNFKHFNPYLKIEFMTNFFLNS
jgi:hypothetical protein